MNVLHYLFHGTQLGIVALVLILLGLILVSFAQISIHRNSSFSGEDVGFSHRLLGSALIFSGFVVIALVIFFGLSPISSLKYARLLSEVKSLPEAKPVIQRYLNAHPHLNNIDYFYMESDIENLKQQLYIQHLSA